MLHGLGYKRKSLTLGHGPHKLRSTRKYNSREEATAEQNCEMANFTDEDLDHYLQNQVIQIIISVFVTIYEI